MLTQETQLVLPEITRNILVLSEIPDWENVSIIWGACGQALGSFT